jgi:carbon-monoxide dehydrogenase large subunit
LYVKDILTGNHFITLSVGRRKKLADALGISINQVRILTTDAGGGFGGKGTLVAEAPAVALARFAEGRPVRVVFSREEELSASQTRHAAYLHLKTGVKRDGTLIARSADLLWDKAAYASKGPEVTYRGALTIFDLRNSSTCGFQAFGFDVKLPWPSFP